MVEILFRFVIYWFSSLCVFSLDILEEAQGCPPITDSISCSRGSHLYASNRKLTGSVLDLCWPFSLLQVNFFHGICPPGLCLPALFHNIGNFLPTPRDVLTLRDGFFLSMSVPRFISTAHRAYSRSIC